MVDRNRPTEAFVALSRPRGRSTDVVTGRIDRSSRKLGKAARGLRLIAMRKTLASEKRAGDGADERAGGITVVLPTYNRAAALRANLPSILALEGVDEVLIVNDGSKDDTVAVCEAIEDRRLRVINHARNLGVAAARNTGVEAAGGAWVLFAEDDCRFPANYVAALYAEARRLGADVVGAPLLNVAGSEEEVAEFVSQAPRAERFPMDGTSTIPAQAIETPFVPARALVHKAVFKRISFYEGFLVNGYREETDFFVQAARAGFRCIVTPATYCYQAGFWGGGQHHSSTLRYEYWAIRNNWRFLQRHGDWLAERRYISNASSAQIGFVALRARLLLAGAAQTRIRRIADAVAKVAVAGRSAS
jgi:glycosyltransferase involved in cell wall biosynthesis